MKYRVVGWTEYDNFEVKAAPCSEAALQAVTADIKKHGYEFSGYDHQEMMNCAPVLNDGKKRIFSQRSFGGVMARAHGNFSRMGYAEYAFDWESDGKKMPPKSLSFDPYNFTPEEDLNEEIVHEVSPALFSAVKTGEEIKIPDAPALTFLDVGDTLTLVCGEERRSFLVKEMSRMRDLTEEDEIEIMTLVYTFEPEKEKIANEKFESAPWVLLLTLA